MLDIITSQRDKILPPPNVLHARSRIDTDIVIVNGQPLELSRFDNDITSNLLRVDEITFKNGSLAGDRFRYDTITSGGIDRGVSVYRPAEHIDKGYPFSVLMDTAWFTGLEGHNDRVAEIIMKTLGVSVVLVGPEFSSFQPKTIGAETNLGRIAALSTGISLMQSAEASASIYAHLKQEEDYLGLKDEVYSLGESRAAMIAQIRRIYLECFGISAVASDLTDPNMSERAFTKFSDSLKLLVWPVREAAGAASVGVSNLLHGEFRRLKGTFPLDKRYLIGATVGTGPALFSGEEGLGAAYTDYEHIQFILNFKGSGAAQADIRRENYRNHPNCTFKEKCGCHMSLAHPSVLSYVIARGLAYGDTVANSTLPLTRSNIIQIHAAKPSQRLSKHVVQEEIAA